MTTTSITDGDKIVIRVEGKVDTSTAEEFSKAVDMAFNKTKNVILNCEKLSYISSAGLRVLLSAHKKAKGEGGRFEVSNVNEEILDIFEVTGFSDILNIV